MFTKRQITEQAAAVNWKILWRASTMIGSIKLESILSFRTCIVVKNILLPHKMWVLCSSFTFYFIKLCSRNLKFKFTTMVVHHVLPTANVKGKAREKVEIIHPLPSCEVFWKFHLFHKNIYLRFFICHTFAQVVKQQRRRRKRKRKK